jgi:hypothetical protein
MDEITTQYTMSEGASMEIPHTYEAAPAVDYGFITPNTTFRNIQDVPPAPPHIEPQHQVEPQNQVAQPSTHTFEVKKTTEKRSWSEAENEALRAAVAEFGVHLGHPGATQPP